MLREYVVSEAMHALGIPTTRALAAVATGQEVIRERPLPGAVLTRLPGVGHMPHHVREDEVVAGFDRLRARAFG